MAVVLGKPLVSGAAQKYEGQLAIYNLGPDGPCYRCLFPKPPAQETIGTCEETGILGAVTGIIGNLQALETIKLITGLHGVSILVKPSGVVQAAARQKAFNVTFLGIKLSAFSVNQTSLSQGQLCRLWEEGF